MAKAPFFIDTNSADPTVRIGLQWEADSIVISNPTIYTIAVRAGSGSVPTSANADMIVPPTSALALPTAAREYVVTATTPTLTNPPDNMPTRVSILLAKSEPPPAFGGIPLAGQPSPALVLLRDQPDRAIGTYADVVNVPAGITTLVMRQFGINMSALSVVGNTSGRIYFELNGPFSGAYVNGTDGWLVTPNGSTVVIRFDRDLDAAITLNITTVNATLNGYTLYGYRERLPAGMYHSDGRLMVDVLPPGQTYLKVAPTTGNLFPVQVVMPARTPVSVKASSGVSGAGAHDYGPITTSGWRGVLIELDLTGTGGGAGVTITPVGLFGGNTYLIGPTGIVATVRTYYEIGPGLGGTLATAAFGIGTSIARDIPDGMYVRITHPDAALYTYAINARPIY